MTNDIELLAALRVAETGLTAAELLALPMDEYARVTGRATPTEAARRALDKQERGIPRQEPPAALQTARESEPQGFDIASMTLEEYAAVRGQLIGQPRQEGRGIFNSIGSRSQEYTDAARRQAGRTGWANGNVVEPPRLTNRFLNHDAQRDTRTAGERFTTPGNSFQI
jgi:hypothetical protein